MARGGSACLPCKSLGLGEPCDGSAASGASLLSLPHRFGSSMMRPCHAVARSTRHQICSQRHRLQSLPQRRQARSPRRRRRSTWPRRRAGICCRRICPTRSSGWMTVNSRRFLRQRSTRRSDAASCRRESSAPASVSKTGVFTLSKACQASGTFSQLLAPRRWSNNGLAACPNRVRLGSQCVLPARQVYPQWRKC